MAKKKNRMGMLSGAQNYVNFLIKISNVLWDI